MKCRWCNKPATLLIGVPATTEWYLSCPKCRNRDHFEYEITIKHFREQPKQWTAHLQEKNWFRMDQFKPVADRITQ